MEIFYLIWAIMRRTTEFHGGILLHGKKEEKITAAILL